MRWSRLRNSRPRRRWDGAVGLSYDRLEPRLLLSAGPASAAESPRTSPVVPTSLPACMATTRPIPPIPPAALARPGAHDQRCEGAPATGRGGHRPERRHHRRRRPQRHDPGRPDRERCLAADHRRCDQQGLRHRWRRSRWRARAPFRQRRVAEYLPHRPGHQPDHGHPRAYAPDFSGFSASTVDFSGIWASTSKR